MTEYVVEERDVFPNTENPEASKANRLNLEEGEFIVDAEYRGSFRLVVAVAVPVVEVDVEEAVECGVCGCAGACQHDCCSK